MGRTANATPQAVVVHENESAVAAGRAALDELGGLVAARDTSARAVAQQLGYELPADSTDPDIIQRDIAANMRRSVEACLEVGRGLMVLKEACEHGQFMGRLEALGVDVNVAGRFMGVARKFSVSNSPPAANFAKAIGSQSKLLELLVLDDEQANELVLTGQTGELKLDDIACMSRNELREALRKVRREKSDDAEAHTRIRKSRDADIAAKQAQIDSLQRELAGKKADLPPEPEPELPGAAALEALAAAALDVVARIDVTFRKHFMDAERAFGDDVPPNHVRLAQQQALTQVIQAAKVLAADHGVDLPLSAATPAELTWLTNMEAVEALRTDDGTPTGLVVPNAWGDAEDTEYLDAEGVSNVE